MSARTAARTAAVFGAAAVLTVAGAGAAMATTAENTVNSEARSVSVTFKLESGQAGDTCGAVLTPTAAAAGVAQKFASGNLETIFNTLTNDPDVVVLKTNLLASPVAFLIPFVNPTSTVSASDVPPNVYSLVSVCVSDHTNPDITPFVVVGNPLEAAQGSITTLSTGDNLTAGSTLSLDAASGNLGTGS